MRNKEALKKHISEFNSKHNTNFGIYWESHMITFNHLNHRSNVFTNFKEAKAFVIGYLTAYEQLNQ